MLSNLSRLQDSPDSDVSPSDKSFTLRKTYGELGHGRPNTFAARGPGAKGKLHSLMRRSSSGAFSSSSSEGSPYGTPTKLTIPGMYLHYHLIHTLTLLFPDALRPPVSQPRQFRLNSRPSLVSFPQPPPNEHEKPGKFEKDFVIVEKLGSGEFGSAIKVRYTQGNADEVFAIKKSKRLEGVKHRYVSLSPPCGFFTYIG